MTTNPEASVRDTPPIDGGSFAVLASERRRIALRRLQDADGTVPMADLASEAPPRNATSIRPTFPPPRSKGYT